MKDSNSNSIVVFADKDIGYSLLKFLLNEHKGDLKAVVLVENSLDAKKIYNLLKKFNFSESRIHYYNNNLFTKIKKESELFDSKYFFLLWWPKIIKKDLIEIPSSGVINIHPSYLPFCRGKDPNYWALKDDLKFGVSIHKVTPGIDDGPILFQEEIIKTWNDNGKTLYLKSLKKIKKLFKKSYSDIMKGNYKLKYQDNQKATFHFRKELDPSSEIFLDKNYSGKEILNQLRARTFKGYPSCWFMDNGKKYEVTIKISEVNED